MSNYPPPAPHGHPHPPMGPMPPMPPGYPHPYAMGMMPMPLKPRLPKQPPCTTPCCTLYVSHLPERLKIPKLKDQLLTIFADYGEVLEIVAHGHLRMKGQAFIVYAKQDDATKAFEATQGRLFHGKPMVVQYARSNSYTTIKRDLSEAATNSPQVEEAMENYKRQKQEEKQSRDKLRQEALALLTTQMQQAFAPPVMPAEPGLPPQQPPRVEPLTPYNAPPHLFHLLFPGMAPPTAAQLAPPPNKILFLQELTAEVTEEDLVATFKKYNGFKEVRLVPGKADIAFVEYEDEPQAVAVMKDLGDTHEIKPGCTMHLSYAKR
ncbi:hypothetical protein H4R35_003203 [Dimargaris xerosporica]|nr:hypothetical protein H4R35_003203 [Dimargaris xerosporica]